MCRGAQVVAKRLECAALRRFGLRERQHTKKAPEHLDLTRISALGCMLTGNPVRGDLFVATDTRNDALKPRQG